MNHIAVVILNYNGEKLLKQFLPSVLENTHDAAIYVADNGSADGSIHVLKNDFPSVNIIRLSSNYGFCKGYNEALKHVVADVYVLLNSDVEVTPGWLKPINHLFMSDPAIAAIQPKILSYNEKNKFEYAGAAGGLLDSLGYPFCRGRIFRKVETDQGQYDDERAVFWASGACLAIRSPVFHSLGGFDEDLFAHMEEIDLCWRIHRSSQKVFYTGKSTVYHLGAGTLHYNNPRKTYLNFRNNLLMLTKQLSTTEVFYKIPLRLALDWIAAIAFLLQGQWQNTLSVFKAHLAWMYRLPSYVRKRKALRHTYPVYTNNVFYSGLILFDSIFRKRRITKYQ